MGALSRRSSAHRLVALFGVFALVLAACSGSATPTPQTSTAPGSTAPQASSSQPANVYKLSVLETTPGFFDIPLKIMMQEGLATANNLDLSIAQFQTGSGSTSQIFAGGTGDIMMGGIDAPVGLKASNTVDPQVIGVLLQRGVWQLVAKAGSPYTSLATLKGKIVGISGAGSFSDFALRQVIQQAGLSPSDFQIAALGNAAAQYAALVAGKADAVQLQAPLLNTALSQGNVQVVTDFQKDLIPGLVFTARTAAVQADPAPYKAFMTAIRQAMDKLRADPAYAFAEAKKYYGTNTTDADLQAILDAYLNKPGIWTTDGVYTQQIHDAGEALMVASGKYTQATYPTVEQLTQYAPNSFK